MILRVQPRVGVDIARAEQVLVEELQRLRTTSIPDEELRKAKNQLLMEHYRERKTNGGRANLLGRNEIFFGDYRRLFTVERDLEAVTSSDVKRVAEKYFAEAKRTVAILVPSEE